MRRTLLPETLIGFCRRFAKFGTVGGIGFVVDAGFLALFYNLGAFNPYAARLVSIALAMAVTWRLNRSMTFSPSQRGQLQEGARYGGIAILTALVNYALYSALLILVPNMTPIPALVIASAVTMFMSYFGYSRLVFGR